jgi:hypothetical protein
MTNKGKSGLSSDWLSFSHVPCRITSCCCGFVESFLSTSKGFVHFDGHEPCFSPLRGFVDFGGHEFSLETCVCSNNRKLHKVPVLSHDPISASFKSMVLNIGHFLAFVLF